MLGDERLRSVAGLPALIHVTHWKAGSQWVRRILTHCFPDRVVAPQVNEEHFFGAPVQEGRIYPTVYATKERFERALLPARWYRFLVFRDLRDTAVSAYFSIRYSHPVTNPVTAREILPWRAYLAEVSLEEGLLWILREWLPKSAEIQYSWLSRGHAFFRYEDLLERDVEIFSQILKEAGWSIPASRLTRIVLANRFEQVTGRQRGQEDVMDHHRKAQPGDWQNYFSKKVKREFKELYGQLLLMAGYERTTNW